MVQYSRVENHSVILLSACMDLAYRAIYLQFKYLNNVLKSTAKPAAGTLYLKRTFKESAG